MTLSRQLIFAMSVIFLLALLGVQAIRLNSAQRHLQDQLESLAQDTATSLGLSLGSLLRDDDIALANTVINPIFDRGHYQEIEFISHSGAQRVSKVLPAGDTGDYPLWFAEFFPLVAPSAESLVSTGWRQLGKLRVRAHPRYAYAQLWATALNTALCLLAIYGAGLFAIRLFLLGVLRPLAAIERAAQAISAHDFVAIALIPSTRELRRVVNAMNALSRRIREVIATETARADALQREAYIDEVSGLLNRRGFIAHIESTYRDERGAYAGTFALIEIPELGPINREIGSQRCDELLRALGRIIEETAAGLKGLAARHGGAIFALLIPRLAPEAAHTVLVELQALLDTLVAERGLPGQPQVSIGAVAAPEARADLDVLANAAAAMLLRARQQGEGCICLHTIGIQGDSRHADFALAAVRDALASRRIQLVGQQVKSLPDRCFLHTEIMARIDDESGTTIAAADFIAIVAQHGLMRQLDEAVIARVCQTSQATTKRETIAINLSVRSLEDGDFIERLSATIASQQPLPMRLILEISEHGVVQNEPAVARLAKAMAPYDIGVAIDHFGVHRNSLALVQRLKPAYLKLSSIHTKNLLTDTGTRFYIEAVVRAARQFEIPVIAQNVEEASILTVLETLGVGGYQGYLDGKPTQWPAPGDPKIA